MFFGDYDVANAASTNDYYLVLQQGGIVRQISYATMLGSLASSIQLPPQTLYGNPSNITTAASPIYLGTGLTLNSGTLSSEPEQTLAPTVLFGNPLGTSAVGSAIMLSNRLVLTNDTLDINNPIDSQNFNNATVNNALVTILSAMGGTLSGTYTGSPYITTPQFDTMTSEEILINAQGPGLILTNLNSIAVVTLSGNALSYFNLGISVQGSLITQYNTIDDGFGNATFVNLRAATLNNTPIGAGTPSTGNFTTLSAANASLTTAAVTSLKANSINSSVIGNTAPTIATFTTVNASVATFGSAYFSNGAQASSINSTPVGNVSPSTGAFTTLNAATATLANSTLNTAAITLATINTINPSIISNTVLNVDTVNANVINDAVLDAVKIAGTPGNLIRAEFIERMTAKDGVLGYWWVGITPPATGNITSATQLVTTDEYINYTSNQTLYSGAKLLQLSGPTAYSRFIGYVYVASGNYVVGANVDGNANVIVNGTYVVSSLENGNAPVGNQNNLQYSNSGTISLTAGLVEIIFEVTTSNSRSTQIMQLLWTPPGSTAASLIMFDRAVNFVDASNPSVTTLVGGLSVAGSLVAGEIIGKIDSTPIGSSTPSTAAFTTVNASSATTTMLSANTLVASAGTITTLTSTDAVFSTVNSSIISASSSLHVAGNASLTGTLFAAEIDSTPVGTKTAASGNFTTLVGNTGTIATLSGTTATFSSGIVAEGGLNNTQIGNTTPSTAAFTTVAVASLNATSAAVASLTATNLVAAAATINGGTINNVVIDGTASSGTFSSFTISGGNSANMVVASPTSSVGNAVLRSLVTGDVPFAELTANKGEANGYAPLDSNGYVPLANIPASVLGSAHYVGTWNALTNTPSLASSTAPPTSSPTGAFYIVSVAGTTNLDGNTTWAVGDWAIFDSDGEWERVPTQANAVTSVAGKTGNVTLSVTDVSGAAPLNSPTFTGTAIIPSASINEASISGTLAGNFTVTGTPTFGFFTCDALTASAVLADTIILEPYSANIGSNGTTLTGFVDIYTNSLAPSSPFVIYEGTNYTEVLIVNQGGSLVAAAINSTPIGNATPSSGIFTVLTASTGNFTYITLTNNLQAGSINSTPIGNTTPSTGTFTTLNSTLVNVSTVAVGAGKWTTSGLQGVAIGNISPSIGDFTTIGGTLATLTSIIATTISAASATLTSLSLPSLNSTVIGNSSPATATFTTLTANIANLATMTLAAGLINSLSATNITVGALAATSISSGAATITGGNIDSTPIGANHASTGNFSTLTSNNATITGGAINGAAISSSNVSLTGGAINGVTIGGSTQAAGYFTYLAGSSVTAGYFLNTGVSVLEGSVTAGFIQTSSLDASGNIKAAGISATSATLGVITAAAAVISGDVAVDNVTASGSFTVSTISGPISVIGGLSASPAAGDNSTSIATTEFVNNSSAVVLSTSNNNVGRNKIDNEDFGIYQRGTSFVLTTWETTTVVGSITTGVLYNSGTVLPAGEGFYTADRWRLFSQFCADLSTLPTTPDYQTTPTSANITIIAAGVTDWSTLPPYVGSSMALTGWVASNQQVSSYSQLVQRNWDALELSGSTVTVSLYAKNLSGDVQQIGASYNIYLGDVVSGNTTAQGALLNSSNIILSNVSGGSNFLESEWGLFTGTLVVPSIVGQTAWTGTNAFAQLTLWLAATPDYQFTTSTGVVTTLQSQVSSGVSYYYLQITGVQLEVGPRTPLENKSSDIKLADCLGYYVLIGVGVSWWGQIATVGESAGYWVAFPSCMLRTPTVTITNVVGAGMELWPTNGGVNSVDQFGFNLVLQGLATGNCLLTGVPQASCDP